MSSERVCAGNVSSAIEDYLRAMLTLAGANGTTTVRALAEKRAISCPSVSQMVRRLISLDLVRHDHYGSIALTASGAEAAERLHRRYQLMESYLVVTLGYSPTAVAVEVDRIEHAVSPRLLERMAERLATSAIPDGIGDMWAAPSA